MKPNGPQFQYLNTPLDTPSTNPMKFEPKPLEKGVQVNAKLQMQEPQKFDPSFRENTFNDVPFKAFTQPMSPAAWRGQTYISSDMMRPVGYTRSSLKSTLD